MKRFKKLFKVMAIMLCCILLILAGVISYINWFLPRSEAAPLMKVEVTPERVKRGEYLANSVMACMGCHSSRNWNKPGAPVISETLGKGGEKFTQDSLGFFGDLYYPNITPAALKNWTDGEIFRAITTGVGKNGSALNSIMPYSFYGKIDSEDIKSVIAYLRTLKPIVNDVPKSNLPFFIRLLNNMAPEKPHFIKRPSEKDSIAYGNYLATAAGCVSCHSPFNGPFGVDYEKSFSGGPEFTMEAGHVKPANLTPDIETGIGLWTKQDFINRFTRFRDTSTTINAKKDFTSLMPWSMFAGMNDKDLGAIYSYLKTLKPIKNNVVKFVPNK